MQKRKLKLNILDVVIVVAVICSVAALIFRDTISDTLGKPEIVAVEATLSADNADKNFGLLLVSGSTVELEIGNNKVQAVVVWTARSEIKVSLNGYEKLGRFYTESGYQIDDGLECAVGINGVRFDFTMKNIGLFEQIGD